MTWWKQGLSSLGEGISSLTKEILSEENDGSVLGSTTGISSATALGSDQRTETETLRAIIIELEERAQSAENLVSNNTLQYQQLVKSYEASMISMRDQIHDLQSQLELMRSLAPVPQPSLESVEYPPVYVDVDLNSKSLVPERNSKFLDYPALLLANGMNKDTQMNNLLKEDNSESGLLDLLENHLSEKDVTIRHLTQELLRAKNVIRELEISSNRTALLVDATVQSESIEVKSAASGASDSELDGSAQTDYLCSVQSVSSSTQVDSESEVRDASSSCSITLSNTDCGVQTNQETSTREYSEQSSQEIQTLPDDRLTVKACDAALQTDSPSEIRPISDVVEICCQTDFVGTIPETDLIDQASQTNGVEDAVSACIDSAAQWDNLLFSDLKSTQTITPHTVCQDVQTDVPIDAVSILTSDFGAQTCDIPTWEVEIKTCSEIDCQTDVTGNVFSQQEIAKIQHEVQVVYSEYSNSRATNERLHKELERLRVHLVDVEQGYAMDFQNAEIRGQELRNELNELTSRLASAENSQLHRSVEATEHLSSLQEQINIYLQARDEAVSKLHDAEKKNHQLETSLSTLRMATEHIKRDHRLELDQEREKFKRSSRSLEEQISAKTSEISLLTQRVAVMEKERAHFSSMISEVELLRLQVKELSQQLSEKEQQLLRALAEASIITGGKVDKALMKSMILAYIAGPKGVQNDVLRLLMATLELNDSERDKIQSAHASVFKSLFSGPSSKALHVPDESFSNLLVRFVEEESRPKHSAETVNGPLRLAAFNSSSADRPVPQTPRKLRGTGNIYSAQNSEKQDQVLKNILDQPNPDVSSKPSIDTV